MLRELRQLVDSFLPPIDPAAIRQLRDQLEQQGDLASRLLLSSMHEEIRQGDILGPLSFVFQRSDGQAVGKEMLGMIISQSCDIDHDDVVLVAPCLTVSEYRDAYAQPPAHANTKTDLMYVPGLPGYQDVIVDLGRVQGIPTGVIRARQQQGALNRTPSFSPVGYYFFLAKLTVHLLRPEGRAEQRFDPSVGRTDRLKRLWLDVRCSAAQNLTS